MARTQPKNVLDLLSLNSHLKLRIKRKYASDFLSLNTHFIPNLASHFLSLNSHCMATLAIQILQSSQLTVHEPMQSYSKCTSMEQALQIHAILIKTGLNSNPLYTREILKFSAVSPDSNMGFARSIFDQIHNRDVISYNTMIRGYSSRDLPFEALSLYNLMKESGVDCDHYTFPFVLKACARLYLLKKGMEVHGFCVKLGLSSDIFVQNALVHMYGNCGEVLMAQKVFDGMGKRDVVSWSSAIGCYVRNGLCNEALDLFQAMQIENMRPDEVTMVSVVSACTSLGALELGKWVHHYLSRNGFELTVTLGTALMDMYAKCGCLEGLLKIFHKMPQRNLLTWTSLIGGLAINGRSLEALTAYESMKEAGMRPDDITLIGVLSACSHGGLVQEGWSHFHSIKQEFKMEPRIEHYGCMVDLLGRAGQLEEAYQFIESLPIKPNSIMWRTLLGACASHGNLELGRLVSNRILEIELDHEGDYVLLSNIYGGLGRWADKAGVRNLMRERGIEKRPGCSIVEVDGVIHEFVAGDESHPRYKEINEMVANIMRRLKLEGYVPDVSNVLFDIDNEEKEKVLSYHGEKLAMAFSLLSTRNGVPIRIVKNLRICRDCHNVMKLVSEMFDREIIVRDRNRFHHFRNKSCSCGDYW
ncbi:hypothetical protein AMTRI_Chr06g169930 [Amborella trichopoda]